MNQELFERHAQLAREIAAEGMVLLENRNQALPFRPNSRLALFGRGQNDFSKGGSGSAAVTGRHDYRLADVLQKSSFQIDSELLEAYRQNNDYLPDAKAIDDAAERCDAAIVVISRNAGEGTDRKDAPGDFRLSEREEALIASLGKSKFRNVVAVVNSGGLIELGWFKGHDNFHALLLCWQPGEDGMHALADIICGKRNPSGRLTDTIATKYSDWPSAEEFQKCRNLLEYSENIYVGYRYFETIPGKSADVLYPFGFGLSYTTFSITASSFECDGKTVILKGNVRNTGKVAGREVVQCYVHAPGMDRPRLELKAFCKTGIIQANNQEDFTLSFPFAELQRFDETGEIGGTPGSFVLEQGLYSFMIGASIRNTVTAGEFRQEKTLIMSSPGNIFSQIPSRRLTADGGYISSGAQHHEAPMTGPSLPPSPICPISLQEVAAGHATIDDFIAQMDNSELVHLCHGHGPSIPRGTGSIGDLPKYGIPAIQTADGPAGIRCAYSTTCFPCATALACTWDSKLQFAMGAAIAEEGLDIGFDILLAPGLNIHRNPLCGRNFEYYSEDPLVSGRSAAAFVNGVQSTGLGATIKHFACNSRENARRLCNSIVSERALREIYLKGFEIAVKESRPWCVMSSYNLINGVHASANASLLTQLLRNEWGFDGIVMTDWTSLTTLWDEILSGNDVKMPCAYKADIERAESLGNDDMGYIRPLPRFALENAARRVLGLVMKSNVFKSQRKEKIVVVPATGCRVDCMDFVQLGHSGIGIRPSNDSEGGEYVFYIVRKNYWNVETTLTYNLNVDESGTYSFKFIIATPSKQLTIKLLIDNEEAGAILIAPTMQDDKGDFWGYSWDCWQTQGTISADLQKGKTHVVKLLFDDPSNIGCSFHYFDIERQ